MSNVKQQYRKFFPFLSEKEWEKVVKESGNKLLVDGAKHGVLYNRKTKSWDVYGRNGEIKRGMSFAQAKRQAQVNAQTKDPGENFLNDLMFDVATGTKNISGIKPAINATKEIGKIVKKSGSNFIKGTGKGLRDFFYDTTELNKRAINNIIGGINKTAKTNIPTARYLQRNLPGGYFKNGTFVTDVAQSSNPGILSYVNKWVLPIGITNAADYGFNKGLKVATGRDWSENVNHYTGMPVGLASWTDPINWWAPYRYMQANNRAFYNQLTPSAYRQSEMGTIGATLPSKGNEIGRAAVETAKRFFYNPQVKYVPKWSKRILNNRYYTTDGYDFANVDKERNLYWGNVLSNYSIHGLPNEAFVRNRIDAHALQFGQPQIKGNPNSIYKKNLDGTYSIDRNEVYNRAKTATKGTLEEEYIQSEYSNLNPKEKYTPEYINIQGQPTLIDNVAFTGARARGGFDKEGNWVIYDQNNQNPFENMSRLNEANGKPSRLMRIGHKLEPNFDLAEATRSLPFVIKHKIPAEQVRFSKGSLLDHTLNFKKSPELYRYNNQENINLLSRDLSFKTDPTWAYKDYGLWGIVPTIMSNKVNY